MVRIDLSSGRRTVLVPNLDQPTSVAVIVPEPAVAAVCLIGLALLRRRPAVPAGL